MKSPSLVRSTLLDSLLIRLRRAWPMVEVSALAVVVLLGVAGCEQCFKDPGIQLRLSNCPADRIVVATGPDGAVVDFSAELAAVVVTYDTNRVYTNISFSMSKSVVPQSGTRFPLGTNRVTIYADLRYSESSRVDFEDFEHYFFNIIVLPPAAQSGGPGGPTPGVGFTNLADFGSGPLASLNVPLCLVEGSDGQFYGATRSIGNERQIVRLAKDGSSGTVLFRFGPAQSAPFNTMSPAAGLARVRQQTGGVTNDAFFGTSLSSANGQGLLFRFNADGTGFSIVRGFTNALTTGLAPLPQLVSDPFGFVYGMTSGGGDYGNGVLYRVWLDGTGFTILKSLPDPGFNTVGGSQNDPIHGPALGRESSRPALFVPFTRNSPALGVTGGFHAMDAADSFPTFHLHDFTGIANPALPWQFTEPRGGLLPAANGAIFGAHGLRSFSLPADASQPSFYFRYTPKSAGGTDSFAVVTNVPANRTPANQTLIEGPEGWVYGYLLGSGHSLVAFHSASNELLTVHDFNSGDLADDFSLPGHAGVVPAGALVAASDGAIYGTAPQAGTNQRGVFWRHVRSGGNAFPRQEAGMKPPPDADAGGSGGQTSSGSGGSTGSRSVNLLPQTQISLSTNFHGYNAGRGLALKGDYFFVGVPFASFLDTNHSGAVHVFRRAGTSWNLESTITPPTNDNTKLFGFAAALDGDTLIVGAPGAFDTNTLAGSAYIYRQSGSNWVQEARLRGNTTGSPGDEFGAAVAIHGDRVVIGAPGFTNASLDHAGAAYAFGRFGTSWGQYPRLLSTEPAALDFFGAAVAVRNDVFVIGAPRSRGLTYTLKPGAAYVFDLFGFVTKLQTIYSAKADLFGASIASGDNFFAIGAPGQNPTDASDPLQSHRGVYIFTNNVEAARLAPDMTVPLEMFGLSVSAESNRVAVGAARAAEIGFAAAPGGAGYVFDFRNGSWNQSARLTSDDPQDGDAFGFTVANSGTWIGASAIVHTNAGALLGSAYLFDVPLVPLPTLSISRIASDLRLQWPAGFNTFQLEYLTDAGSTNWQPVTPAPVSNVFNFTPSNSARFFRLRQP